MRTPLVLLKMIGKAILHVAGAGFLGDLLIDGLPEIANNAWEDCSKAKDRQERRAELEAIARATTEEIRRDIEESANQIAAGQPKDVRQALAG